jgi:hypothetical protein
MRFSVLAIFLLTLAVSANASPECKASAKGSTDYFEAIRLVRNLPEIQAWSRMHSFPVAFEATADRKVFLRNRCYWSVSVYADRPERLEMWHTFYVDTSKKSLLIADLDGDAISLGAWRSKTRKQ